LDVISWDFLFIGVNGATFVRRISDIWVSGCIYVESVTFVRKCNNYFESVTFVRKCSNAGSPEDGCISGAETCCYK